MQHLELCTDFKRPGYFYLSSQLSVSHPNHDSVFVFLLQQPRVVTGHFRVLSRNQMQALEALLVKAGE